MTSFIDSNLTVEERVGLKSQKRVSSLRLFPFIEYFLAKGDIPD